MAKKPNPPPKDPGADVDVDKAESGEPKVEEVQPSGEPPRGRQSAAPTCPYCKQPCKAQRSTAFFTYYKCVTEECVGYSIKQPRPQMRERIEAHRRQEEDFSAR